MSALFYKAPRLQLHKKFSPKPKPPKIPGEPSAVVIGDPIDGITIFGPFSSSEKAIEWGEMRNNTRGDLWWVVSLRPPYGD